MSEAFCPGAYDGQVLRYWKDAAPQCGQLIVLQK